MVFYQPPYPLNDQGMSCSNCHPVREENARLRQRVEELERERDAAWAVRDAGWVQTEDALTRMRTAEARLARCVEAGNHLRGFAAGTDLGKAYIEYWDAAAKGGE